MQTLKTKEIEIVVNGVGRSVPESPTISALLVLLDLPMERVAVELNGAIVKKQDWASTSIDNGANLEIVQFVGGG